MLGAGADDLLMLCARAYAGPGDRVAIADEPSYPLYRVAAWVTGADVGDDDPVLTFVCRPHNPSGAMVDLPAARPLVVDEAYFEYGGRDRAPPARLERRDRRPDVLEGVRARVGARRLRACRRWTIAAELNERQEPAPVSTISAALALAALEAGPPDVAATIAERERLADGLRSLGLEPLPVVHELPARAARARAGALRGAARAGACGAPVTGCDPHHRAPARGRRPSARGARRRSTDRRRAAEHPAGCRRCGRRCRRAPPTVSLDAASCELGSPVIAQVKAAAPPSG